MTVSQPQFRKMMAVDERIRQQRAWMNQCGGNLLGYLFNYGSKDDPPITFTYPDGQSITVNGYSGDGGEAIYEADKHALDQLIAERDRLLGKVTA